MKTRNSLLSTLFLMVSFLFFNVTQAQDSNTKKVKTEYKNSKKVLASFVGTYSFDNGAGAEVTLKEGKLYGAQAGSGEEPMHLVAVSKNKFKLVEMGAEIEFDVDGKGKVTGLTFFQQGQEMSGTKD